ncbi:hypothetical protein BISA_1359 [Bifidobacterium saguini DSM 23967]|uniref:Uncharacterized protein n=1 Tax=Bifidobacterium saguini DSM 23967 TaxID=1437607 RepID=A0A087DCE4_9BIFI|nr:hypothetical protein [Bifidobacterium saguini]KFI93194.1 hypothetical protein BISA_1359 [Bifidobacterium saguini DSM 23967]
MNGQRERDWRVSISVSMNGRSMPVTHIGHGTHGNTTIDYIDTTLSRDDADHVLNALDLASERLHAIYDGMTDGRKA